MIDLSGKRILVTGASKGIGHAIAKLLLEKGAKVGLHYNHTRSSLEELKNIFEPDQSYLFQANLEDPMAAETLFKDALNQMESLETLVINAGIFKPHSIHSSLEEWMSVWNKTINVNLSAAAVLTKLSIEHFKDRKNGRLIYIGSRAAFRGETEEYLAYAASKGGLTSLAKSVARSFGKYNIKAFVLAPGFTRTEMAMDAISKIGEDQVLKNLSLNRLTTPEDIAPLVAFMCSGKMDHATGTTIDMNAGSHIR